MKKTVLCIRDATITPQAEGLIPASSLRDLQQILGDDVWAVPRHLAENDPTFRQVIPYVTLVSEKGEVLAYQRGKAGQEGRLHDLWSIGVGGHTEIHDLGLEDVDDMQENCWEFLLDAAMRELKEELPNTWVSDEDLLIAGVIRLNTTEVDRVHLGVWMIAVVPPEEMSAVTAGTEDTLQRVDWAYLEQLGGLNLEAWSELVAQRLDAQEACGCGGNCGCHDQHCLDDDGA